jgi:queuine tRNA-ribosyltransferase
MKAGEMLGALLLSQINVAYYQELMRSVRAAITDGRFAQFRAETEAGWARGDILPR